MVLLLGRPTVVLTAHALSAVAPLLLAVAPLLLAVAPLLLAVACSAPPGTEDDSDTVPPYSAAGNAPTATNGLQPAMNNVAGSSAVSTSGAGGTTSTEAPGANVGLSPTPAQNTNMGQQMGAAGAPPSSGAAGASGAAGTSGAPPAGSAGSSTMPPTPPPTNPPPVNPPPTNPPPAANANCPGQFLCETFEGVAAGASPNAAIWQVFANYSRVTQDAAVQVSTAQAHTGTQSLRVTASSGRSGIVATLPQNRYFLRAWLQVEAVPLGPVFIGLGTDQNSETRLRIQGRSFATINTVGPGDFVHPDQANSGNCPNCVTLTPNRWFCAEFSIDNATQAATLWIDGVEAASIVNGQGGWPVQPAAPKLFLGSMGVQGGQAGVFIDDVAVGSTRIGCN
ncbi:MAG: hypothetical protein ABI895_06575 [Deltaproteobacteria bacterium]